MDKQRREVILLGAGLAGLTLAYELKKHGLEARILEARDRIGGRIHTLDKSGTTLELGATWFADKHRSLLALIEELKLDKVEQAYGKYALYQHSDGRTQLYELPNQTEPSYRLKGGTLQLINALKAQLAPEQVLLNQKVIEIDFSESMALIKTECDEFSSDLIVNTIPPNLFINRVKTIPEIADQSKDLFKSTHTWMGESIKVGLFSPKPFWLEKNIGTIYSQKGPITEMYDHSNAHGFALKGFLLDQFVSLSKEERELAVRSQLAHFFGQELIDQCIYAESAWRNEELTYAPYPTSIFPHQNNGHQSLRDSFFEGKLIMAGSETAKEFPGYLDGAVEAANATLNRILPKFKETSISTSDKTK